MSQAMDINEDGVQYVLNDTEFVFDTEEINSEGLSDIIYSDGTRAILVNEHGQIIQSDAQTVVLQEGEDLNQYYINGADGEILVTDDQDIPGNETLDGAEIIQYIDEDGSTTEEPQIIYVNEEGFAIQDSDLSQYHIAEAQEDDTFPLKTIKLETQVVDLEELMRQQGEGETAIIENLNEDNGYQYAILKDGKLHIQSYTGDVFPVTSTEDDEEQEITEKDLTDQEIMDLSKITGRNLLTGQTVTLHGYMDKLQKKIKGSPTPVLSEFSGEGRTIRRRKIKKSEALKGLLNKKFTIGKTTSGKRLVGKIIHIENKGAVEDTTKMFNIRKLSNIQLENKNDFSDENLKGFDDDSITDESTELGNEIESKIFTKEDNVSETVQDASLEENLKLPGDKKRIVIHEKIVSKDCFGHISRTLSGLMNMDSVKRKLQYKNIIVKVVEKKYVPSTKTYAKNICYSSGYMEEEFVVNDAGEVLENWCFVADPNTKESIFGTPKEEDECEQDSGSNKYLETTNITLIITQEKNKERVIRVILNTTNSNKCTVCGKEFRSNLQLRVHINNVHKADGILKMCEVCGTKFGDYDALQEHRKIHVDEGKLFHCIVDGCGKFFLTAGRLKRHSAVHDTSLRPFRLLECSVCSHRCSSKSALKKHLMTHMSIKPFYCETCGKNFTNPGDLNFHKRIHEPYKFYACEICKRTFSRHSNLQRHIEIHKGSGELFQCAICGCSYHYMSSLTRHVVQNHIKRSEPEMLGTNTEHEIDES